MTIHGIQSLKRKLGGMAARFYEPRHLPVLIKGWIIHRSKLFDRSWYFRTTGETSDSGSLALACRFARSTEDRQSSVNPLFDTDWYRTQTGYEGSAADLFVHYVLRGEMAGYRPNPWFDPLYFAQYGKPYGRWRTQLAAYWNRWEHWPHAHPHFDSYWYRWHYQNDGGDDGNPLAHFLHQGINAGHQPNAYLSPSWYCSRFPDAAACLENAFQHFGQVGTVEFRNPGPVFDMQGYASQHPDYQASGLDPLGHYLAIGRMQGNGTGSSRLTLHDLADFRRTIPVPGPRGRASGTLIVTVGSELAQTRACLESIFASKNRTRFRVVVSSDPASKKDLSDYLLALARARRIILIETPAHSATAATAMKAVIDGISSPFVVVLDGRSIVSGDWLDRLCRHAARHPDAGMITALSSKAVSSQSRSRLWDECSVAEADRIADQVNSGLCLDIPGVDGTCTLITRNFLNGVDSVNQAPFACGRGEEGKVAAVGSQLNQLHLLAMDVLVGRAGEEPTSDARRGTHVAQERVEDHLQDAENKPSVSELPAPAIAALLRMTLARWRAGTRPTMAIITHDLGGGTERQVQRIHEGIGDTAHVLIIRPGGHDTMIRVENLHPCDGFDVLIDVVDAEGFARFIRMSGVGKIQLHHLYNHGSIIRDGLARSGVPFTFHVHDYFVICPLISLTTATDQYCGEPARSACDTCIAGRPANGSTDIRNWRDAHEWAVLNADSVVTPSHDAATRLQNYFDVEPIVEYHEPHPTIAVASCRSQPVDVGSPLRVVLLGVLSLTKGRTKVFEAAEVANAQRLPVAFHLVGHMENEPLPDTLGEFTMTGEYLDDDLPDLLAHARPDMFLFASAAPETYAFTLTAAMRTGHPILATDLGAFSERLAGYPHAGLYSHMLSGEELAERIFSFAQQHLPQAFPSRTG